MQRLFLMFPSGAAGVGLLLLRLTVAVTVLAVATAFGSADSTSWTVTAAAALATGLALGFMTPYCAVLCGMMELRAVLAAGRETRFFLAVSIANSLVVAMMGPGAYSLDSRMFGRRVLIIPGRRKVGSD